MQDLGAEQTKRSTIVPNFFVAGTQKSGTTFLCAKLAEHPHVLFSRPKEVFFFGGRDAITKSHFEDYLLSNFKPPKDKRTATIARIGEGSTTYFQSESALANMEKYLGTDFKAMVVLRQPVEKLISYFMHNHQRGRYDSSRRITDKLLSRTSIFAPHARRWVDKLGPQRFLAMQYDLLVRDATKFVNSALVFLELEPIQSVENDLINAGQQMVRRGDFIEPLKRSDGDNSPRFALSELKELQEFFRKDIQETQAITGLDLKDWLDLPRYPTEAEIRE